MRTLLSADKDLHFDGNASPLKLFLFFLVCAAWLVPGLISHDPWKYDEGVTLGIVHGLTHGGSWLSPRLAGEPYTGHPPLFYWVATMMAQGLGRFMPVHDAVRLTTGLFVALALGGVATAARALFGPRATRAAVILMMGSVGLLIRAHETTPEMAWLAGVTWGLAAIPLSARRPLLAGLVGGTGLAVAYLARGPLALGLLVPLTLAAPLLVPSVRPARPALYGSAWLASAILLGAAWPALLQQQPDAAARWWPLMVAPLLNPARWLSPDAAPSYYLGVIAWFAWPATPLALATLWDSFRRRAWKAAYGFPVVVALYLLFVLGIATTPRETNALPLLVPLVLLGAGPIDNLRRGAASAMDWFSMLTFGLVTAALWLGWIAQLTGEPQAVVQYLDAQLPNFRARFLVGPFLVSLFLTLLWLGMILRSRQSPRRALLNWTVGLTVSWLMLMTLWLPYIEASRSYRGVMASLSRALPPNHGCIASTGLTEPERGLLAYYLDLQTQRLETGRGHACHLWLVQSPPKARFAVPPGWRLLWTGARPGDRTERFQLFGD